MIFHQTLQLEGRRDSVNLPVIIFVVGLVTLLTLTFRSSLTFSMREEDSTSRVTNVVSVTLDIEAKALVELDEGCRSIGRSMSTKDPNMDKVM